ncbi:uncharacterized protein LOC131955827 isoform X2 [Physella acuta]|uniref:uncharacterized protein LOC131955827 isoform X2 n=1 Tax=Physella acuta TaxID=109671 RepID=UPI0027DBC6BB|nr:uncharacterized protein LOC131955827 isoform X2 [Physella acuta]
MKEKSQSGVEAVYTDMYAEPFFCDSSYTQEVPPKKSCLDVRAVDKPNQTLSKSVVPTHQPTHNTAHSDCYTQKYGDDTDSSLNSTRISSAALESENETPFKCSSYSELLHELGQNSKLVFMQYLQVFSDSEMYEQQGYQAVEDLNAHSQFLLQELNNQKEMICERLRDIANSLKSAF